MNFKFNSDFTEATDEQKWRQVALWREAELNASDWTQLEDAPLTISEKKEWADYRQHIRDLPETFNDIKDLEINEKPKGKKKK